MHCGHLTRTTTNNVLRCLKFSLSKELGYTVEYLFKDIGLKKQGKDVIEVTLAGIKKAYK